jgi:hypothetical protein
MEKTLEDIKIMIGIPTRGDIRIETTMALIGMLIAARHATSIEYQVGPYIHENRKQLVKKAQAWGATHIFFLDTDMNPDPEVIEKLLVYNCDIVGVNYHTKTVPTFSVVKYQDTTGKTISTTVPTEFHECYALGTGCLLIKMSVFDKIEKPWFFYEPRDEDDDMGEDVWFCRQAQRAGIKSYCDPTIRVGHIGSYEY